MGVPSSAARLLGSYFGGLARTLSAVATTHSTATQSSRLTFGSSGLARDRVFMQCSLNTLSSADGVAAGIGAAAVGAGAAVESACWTEGGTGLCSGFGGSRFLSTCGGIFRRSRFAAFGKCLLITSFARSIRACVASCRAVSSLGASQLCAFWDRWLLSVKRPVVISWDTCSHEAEGLLTSFAPHLPGNVLV